MPIELEIGQYMELYGAGILGRVPGAGELRRITAMRNVVTAHRSRAEYQDANGNENWAEWAQRNPKLSETINRAAEIAEELDDV